MRDILDATPRAWHLWEYRKVTGDLHLIGANPSADRMLGIRHERYFGQTIVEIFPNGLASTIHNYKQIAIDGGTRHFELEYNHRNVSRHFNMYAFQVGYRLLGCSFDDITQQKEAEMRLKTSEEKYRMIFEKSPLGIFHFDAAGQITACNQNLADIIGSLPERVIDFNLVKELKNEKMKAAVQSALSGKTGRYEGDYLSVTGNKRTAVKAYMVPIILENNCVIGGIGIFEDITDRVEIDQKREETIIALQVLLNQRGKDKENIYNEIMFKIRQLVMPLIVHLGLMNLNAKQKAFLELIKTNLKEINSEFPSSLKNNLTTLTPAELRIVNLVKRGKRSKEIAEVLEVAEKTIETHRRNIRKKLGIPSNVRNLEVYFTTGLS